MKIKMIVVSFRVHMIFVIHDPRLCLLFFLGKVYLSRWKAYTMDMAGGYQIKAFC